MTSQHYDFAGRIIGRYLESAPLPFDQLSLVYLQSPAPLPSEPARRNTVLNDVRNIFHYVTENNVLNLHLGLRFVGGLLEKSVRELVAPEIRQLRMLEKRVTVLRRENTVLRERITVARTPEPLVLSGQKEAPQSAPRIGSPAAVAGIRVITELLESYERSIPVPGGAAFSFAALLSPGAGQANRAVPFMGLSLASPSYLPSPTPGTEQANRGVPFTSFFPAPLSYLTQPVPEPPALPADSTVSAPASGQEPDPIRVQSQPLSPSRTQQQRREPLRPVHREASAPQPAASPDARISPRKQSALGPTEWGLNQYIPVPVSMWRYLRLDHRLSSLTETHPKSEGTAPETFPPFSIGSFPRGTLLSPNVRNTSAALLPRAFERRFGLEPNCLSIERPSAGNKLTAGMREIFPARQPLTIQQEAARLTYRQGTEETPPANAESGAETVKTAAAESRPLPHEPLTHAQLRPDAVGEQATPVTERQPVPFVHKEGSIPARTVEASPHAEPRPSVKSERAAAPVAPVRAQEASPRAEFRPNRTDEQAAAPLIFERQSVPFVHKEGNIPVQTVEAFPRAEPRPPVKDERATVSVTPGRTQEAFPRTESRLNKTGEQAAAPLVFERQPVPFIFREENTAPQTQELWEIIKVQQGSLRAHTLSPQKAKALGMTVAGRFPALSAAPRGPEPTRPGEFIYAPQWMTSKAQNPAEVKLTAGSDALTSAVRAAVRQETTPAAQMIYKREAAGDAQAEYEDAASTEPDIEFHEKTTVRTVRETREQKGETVTQYLNGGSSMQAQLDAMLSEMQSPVIVKRIADQVYGVLERRLRTERLRKGLL